MLPRPICQGQSLLLGRARDGALARLCQAASATRPEAHRAARRVVTEPARQTLIAARAGTPGCRAATSRKARAAMVLWTALLVRRNRETFRLQIEHRAVASAERHQLVVRAELNHAAVFEHADAVR